ncbi:MAG: aminotransferase class V-fold PLP-dependent enzyme [Acidobacteriota bacterium]
MRDWDLIREDFPALKRFRYFYTASGGPLPKPVFDKVMACYREALEFGDVHWERNLERLEQVRGEVAELIGADQQEVEFAPSTAWGMNVVAGLLKNEGKVIACRLEFPDTTLPWLHARAGSICWTKTDPSGAVPVEEILSRMSSETAIIATSHVQYSNGFRQDLTNLGHRKGDHYLVVNATQSLGAFRIDVKHMHIDALCCNSYKWLLGAYGCGILYLARKVFAGRPAPGVGWFAVEERDQLRNDGYRLLESAARFNWGSPCFPAIFALGAAVRYLKRIGLERIERRVLELNRYLTGRLLEAGFVILSPLQREEYRSAETLVQLRNPEQVSRTLAERGILCTPKPEGIRVATHFFVNEEDIDQLIRGLERACPGARDRLEPGPFCTKIR